MGIIASKKILGTICSARMGYETCLIVLSAPYLISCASDLQRPALGR